jgi:hypothetical protein
MNPINEIEAKFTEIVKLRNVYMRSAQKDFKGYSKARNKAVKSAKALAKSLTGSYKASAEKLITFDIEWCKTYSTSCKLKDADKDILRKDCMRKSSLIRASVIKSLDEGQSNVKRDLPASERLVLGIINNQCCVSAVVTAMSMIRYEDACTIAVDSSDIARPFLRTMDVWSQMYTYVQDIRFLQYEAMSLEGMANFILSSERDTMPDARKLKMLGMEDLKGLIQQRRESQNIKGRQWAAKNSEQVIQKAHELLANGVDKMQDEGSDYCSLAGKLDFLPEAIQQMICALPLQEHVRLICKIEDKIKQKLIVMFDRPSNSKQDDIMADLNSWRIEIQLVIEQEDDFLVQEEFYLQRSV